MKHFDEKWQKLTTLARQAPAETAPAAPYGFATRVVALAQATPPSNPWSVLERFALRGFVAAAVCGVAAIAFSYSGLLPESGDDIPVDALTFNPAVDIA